MHPNCLTEYVEKTPLEEMKNLHQVYMQEQYSNILKEIRNYVKNGKTKVTFKNIWDCEVFYKLVDFLRENSFHVEVFGTNYFEVKGWA